jgi:glucosamine-6-phosphate deaminase
MPLTPQQFTISTEELISTSKILFKVLPDSDSLFAHMARSITDEIQVNNLAEKPTRLILPVGPVGQYPLLVNICNQERISWKNVYTFNMDEYCDWQGRPLPSDHPLSFKNYMLTDVFGKLDQALRIPFDQVHFPDPLDLDAISYKIREIGGIDTCYGGIGYHGHIAFNEPPNNLYTKVSIEDFMESKHALFISTRTHW